MCVCVPAAVEVDEAAHSNGPMDAERDEEGIVREDGDENESDAEIVGLSGNPLVKVEIDEETQRLQRKREECATSMEEMIHMMRKMRRRLDQPLDEAAVEAAVAAMAAMAPLATLAKEWGL